MESNKEEKLTTEEWTEAVVDRVLKDSNKEEEIITCKTCGENCKGYCFDTKEDRDMTEEEALKLYKEGKAYCYVDQWKKDTTEDRDWKEEWDKINNQMLWTTATESEEVKDWIESLLTSQLQKERAELKAIMNRCKTERGLAVALANYINKE